MMETLLANRYQIKANIGSGAMGTVFRAYDRLTAQHVAIKRVIVTMKTTEERLALAKEFRMLASLRFPKIISVLNYGFDDKQQPFLVMELLENAQPIHIYAAGRSHAQRVNLLIQLLQALVYLHRRNIVHRDIKPENVLVVDGNVKVLDFGLATATHVIEPDAQDDDTTVGTLAYMAPEIITGASASIASDLYAVGVIAYELFAGVHPFASDNINLLIRRSVLETPNIKALNVSQGLANVISRLLSKDPTDRYPDAHSAMQAIALAEKITLHDDLATIQESYLQSAAFIGREREMDILTQKLNELEGGKGSFWLVGGESGIGKTRLLTELRTQALVKGLSVFTGQVNRDGNTLYQLWRMVLRSLCIQTSITPEDASILQGIIPDIATLLQVDIPPYQPLTPQENQERLLALVEDLITQYQRPCLILLEDIHWAMESLLLLERVSQLTSQQPLMIVASYRTDDPTDIVKQFPHAQRLQLERLKPNHIDQLSQSILGKTSAKEELSALLQRETEGNVLFILEVLRTLAQDAGGLDKVGTATLPQRILTGDIRKILGYRLSRLSPQASELLKQVAVIGREIDTKVLEYIHPDIEWEILFSQWNDAAILEVNNDVWQFTHEKLREYILEPLDGATLATLHKHVAHALETLYPDELNTYPILAYHWQRVGNPTQELHYTYLAGDQSLYNGAYREAANYYQRAYDLINSLPEDAALLERKLQVMIALGMALIPIHGDTAPTVIQMFSQAQALIDRNIGKPNEIFKVLYNQSIYYMSTAELPRALSLSEQCLRRAEAANDIDLLIEGHYTYSNVLFWMGEFQKADDSVEQVIALYDPRKHISHSAEYGQDPFTVCLTYGTWNKWILGYPEQALALGFGAFEVAKGLASQSFNLAMATQTLAWQFYHLRDIDACADYAQQLVTLSESEGFAFYLALGRAMLGWALAQQGDTKRGTPLIRQALQDWQALNAQLLTPFYSMLLAEAEIAQNNYRFAQQTLLTSIENAQKNHETCYLSELHRLHSQVCLALNNPIEGRAALETALEISTAQGARLFMLRALCDLYTLEPSAAHRQALEELYAGFTEGFDTRDLLRARALLGVSTP